MASACRKQALSVLESVVVVILVINATVLHSVRSYSSRGAGRVYIHEIILIPILTQILSRSNIGMFALWTSDDWWLHSFKGSHKYTNTQCVCFSPQSSCWEPRAPLSGHLTPASSEFIPLTLPWPTGSSSVHGVSGTQLRTLTSLFPCLAAPPAPLLPSLLPHAS